jgi:hypothetical protein
LWEERGAKGTLMRGKKERRKRRKKKEFHE